jgi:hypothetical protein
MNWQQWNTGLYVANASRVGGKYWISFRKADYSPEQARGLNPLDLHGKYVGTDYWQISYNNKRNGNNRTLKPARTLEEAKAMCEVDLAETKLRGIREEIAARDAHDAEERPASPPDGDAVLESV